MLDKSIALIEFAEWSVCTKTYSVKGYGADKELSPLNFKILIYFVSNPNRIITRDEFIEAVWENGFVDDNAINKAISDLRRALKTDDSPKDLIKTHYKKGYSFNAEVEFIQGVFSNSLEPRLLTPEEKADQVKLSQVKDVPEQKREADVRAGKTFKLAIKVILSLLLISCIAFLLIPGSEIKKAKVHSKKISLSESVYLYPLLSPKSNLLAISKQNPDLKKEELFFVDLQTFKNTKVISEKYDVYAVGWSQDASSLYYQIISIKDDFCEIWRADLNSMSEIKNKNLVFKCNSHYLFSAVTDESNNSLIYTKFGYRGVTSLSVLIKRNLNTGEEFQVSSPNIESLGDRFVTASPAKQKLAFVRWSEVGSQIFIGELDGSRQEMIYESKETIYRVNWSGDGNRLMWFNGGLNAVKEYSLVDKKIKVKKFEKSEQLRMVIPSDGKLYATTRIFDKDIVLIEPQRNRLENFANSSSEEFFASNSSHGDYFFKETDIYELHKVVEGEVTSKKLMSFDFEKINATAVNSLFPLLAVASEDGLFIYDLTSKELIDSINIDGSILDLEWLNEQQLLLIRKGSGSDEQNLWRIDLGQGVSSLQKVVYKNVEKAQVIADDVIVYQDKFNNFSMFNLKQAEEKHLFSFPDMPSLRWYISGGKIIISNRLQVFEAPLLGGELTTIYDLTESEPQSVISEITKGFSTDGVYLSLVIQRLKFNSVILLEEK